MKLEEYENVAETCKMLADKTRVAMIALLADGKSSVGDLCDKLKLPQPTVSHHLALLRMSRVVDRKRQGREMHYSLNPDSLAPVKQFIDAHAKASAGKGRRSKR